MLAASLAFMPVTPAFAEDGDPTPTDPTPTATTDYDHPLKVTGLSKDDVARFYKILEWAPDAEGNVAGWKAVAPFASVLDEAKLTEVLLGTEAVADDPDTPEDETKAAVAPGITSELAGELARCVTASTATVGNPVTVAATEAQLDNPAAGLYMALITPANIDTVYNPVFVAADWNKTKSGDVAVTEAATYSDTAAAKKSTVTLDKQATTADSQNRADFKWTTVAIGDTVDFTVTTTIPGYGKMYQHPSFKITDKLTDLTLKTDTVALSKPTGLTAATESQTVNTEGVDYKVTATATGYTIEFSEAYLKTCATPTEVEVTYQAIVSTTAPKHVNTEKNEVATEFSHNPSDESDHGFKRDTTEHYSFTLDADILGSYTTQTGKKTSELVKVGQNPDGSPITETTEHSTIDEEKTWKGPLDLAEFGLFTDAACTTPYIPKGTDGKPLAKAPTYVSNTDGRLGVMNGDTFEAGIRGLDAGTYYLMETKAPTGFIKDSRKIPIVITATTKEVTLTQYTTDGVTWVDAIPADATDEQKAAYKSYTFKTDVLDTYTVTIDGKKAAEYHFTNVGIESDIIWTETPPVEVPSQLVNTKGVELPSTGGMGTRILYTIGGIMLVGGAIALVSKKRAANME